MSVLGPYGFVKRKRYWERVMDSPRITYTPRSGATPEHERTRLGHAWALIFSAYDEQKKKAGGWAAGDGTKGTENDHPARRILPR